MIASIHRNCDEEDLDLVRRSCSGSFSALVQLLDRHRAFLYYLYLNWYGIEYLATESLESLQFRITVRLRYRPPHMPVRLWLYRLAVEQLLDSEITLSEQFVHYPLQWRHPASPNTPPDKSRCYLLRYAPFDCRSGVLLSLNRLYRTAFILNSMLGIKPVIGARIMNIPLPRPMHPSVRRSGGSLPRILPGYCHRLSPTGSFLTTVRYSPDRRPNS